MSTHNYHIYGPIDLYKWLIYMLKFILMEITWTLTKENFKSQVKYWLKVCMEKPCGKDALWKCPIERMPCFFSEHGKTDWCEKSILMFEDIFM